MGNLMDNFDVTGLSPYLCGFCSPLKLKCKVFKRLKVEEGKLVSENVFAFLYVKHKEST